MDDISGRIHPLPMVFTLKGVLEGRGRGTLSKEAKAERGRKEHYTLIVVENVDC